MGRLPAFEALFTAGCVTHLYVLQQYATRAATISKAHAHIVSAYLIACSTQIAITVCWKEKELNDY
jgi:hypothetical protein